MLLGYSGHLNNEIQKTAMFWACG